MQDAFALLWESFSDNERVAINLLNKIQADHGFIPQELLADLSKRLNIPESQLHGLVSFFDSFRVRPAGKHKIRICYGTACYAKGAPLINDRLVETLHLEDSDTSEDGLVTVEQVYCVGACSQAPIIIQDDEMLNRVKSYQVPIMVDNLRKKS
jgi:NADH:ubiquinone oxidoreductase 24 kD subunit